MWRVQGFVGRVLQRYYGNTQLRLPQNHHVEDEVINTSAVLSTSRHGCDRCSQREEDGERRRKQKTFDFGQAELPRYTAIDAVSWGAAAVLFMQICRRIHSKFNSGTEPSPTPGPRLTRSTLHKCGYRFLLEILCKNDVLPGGRDVLCLQAAPEGPKRELQTQSSINSSSSGSGGVSVHSSSSSSSTHDASAPRSGGQHQLTSDPERPLLIQDSAVTASFPLQNDGQADAETAGAADQNTLSHEDKLVGAALNLKKVGDNSVTVVLNIIGLESAKSGKYEDAFICFKAAAEQGYSKAQFNVGVCYEKGRGVHTDREKALHYYWQAAVGGHRQAQYRHAKLLLSSRGQQSAEALNTAISFLEESARAGLTEAQVCLASVYSQDPFRDESKSVHYLKMAADRGNDSALLFLGQCYESGFGVQRNVRTAREYYKRAVQAGNKQAKSLLTPANATNSEDAMLRSISSAPCFSAADRHPQQPLSPHLPPPAFTLPLLPHSWSTGSLCIPPYLSSSLLPLNTEGGTCQWTLGLG